MRRFESVADQLEAQIHAQVFRPGDRLPSVRALRRQCGVSMTTAADALAELERRGLAEARPRSGTYVKTALPASPPPLVPRPEPTRVPMPHLADDFVTSSSDQGSVPLGGAVLGPDLLPLSRLARIARVALQRPEQMFGRYGPPAGDVKLRQALARHLRSRGLSTTPDDVVVTAGCMDAVRLALSAVARSGDIVAVGSPTFFGFLQLIRASGYLALPIPIGPEGLDVDALRQAIGRHAIRALVTTPTLHNPTGTTWTDARREEVLALAFDAGIAVVEDDVYGDLADPPSPRPLACRDERVLYCTSLSKTVTPGLRVGAVVGPRHTATLVRAKLAGGITSPALNQRIAERFLAEGHNARHLRRLKERLRTQRRCLHDAVLATFPEGTVVSEPAGGFLLWVELPRPIDLLALYHGARREGISFLPGPMCAVAGGFDRHLRLAAGYPWSDDLEAGVARLGALIIEAP